MKVLYTAGEIAERIAELGEKISQAYQGHELLIVGILKGGFMFMADLVRKINIPIKIDFARLSSYGNADSPMGDVMIIDDIHTAIAGKHVLVVDDIMDTGHSLHAFRKHLWEKGPASVRICTMIDKSERRKPPYRPTITAFVSMKGLSWDMDWISQRITGHCRNCMCAMLKRGGTSRDHCQLSKLSQQIQVFRGRPFAKHH
jgi:hypoxanthine phosphoribosyltransferase